MSLSADHLYLARWYARRVHRGALTRRLAFEDVEAAAALGLVEAERRFDPQRGLSFSTLAYHHMRFQVQEAERRGGFITAPRGDRADPEPSKRARRQADDVVREPLADRGDPPDKLAVAAEEVRLVAEAVGRLRDKDRAVIEAVYRRERTLKQAGEELGVSRSRARNIHNRAVDRLRVLLGGGDT